MTSPPPDHAPASHALVPPAARWRVLLAFVLAAMVTQLLWLNFAPMLVEIEQRYGISDDLASLLVLPFPLLYVFLSMPAGRLIDRLGYRKVVGWGAIVGALGSLLRLDTDHFWSLVAGQVVIAVAQPFVVNAINKLVADWFEGDEQALATGLGTVGMFLGMALGLATTPALDAAFGLRGAMLVNSAVAFGVVIAWYALCRERGVAQPETPSPMLDLFRNRKLMVFVCLALLGLGYFNGLTTWLEQLLAPRGLDSGQAGVVGGVIVVGGIVGAILVPLLADHLRLRRWPLILCVLFAGLSDVWLTMAHSYDMLLASSAALGFFFMPAFALLLAMTGEVVDRQDNGAATGIVMLAGNAGGVAVIVSLPMMGDWGGMGPWAMLGGLITLALAVAWFAPETFPTTVPKDA
ncbi:MAG: major facilitator superfamily domain-containing protein 7 [Oligoflexia bacterium]|nr:major facilitator superfamily domain-containing protein 7 [Oligoflexia bacterium]